MTQRKCRTKEELLEWLDSHLESREVYEKLDEEWKNRFIAFCEGRQTLPLTYDPFFKRIFSPERHPERLNDFLKEILKKDVTVLEVLPTEHRMFTGESLIIMDILVRMDDGSLADIEFQKIPYTFLGERLSCYLADLLIREYEIVRNRRGSKFMYKDVKTVYSIVLYEKSTKEMRNEEHNYIHHGAFEFDTDIKLNLLMECYLISLDEWSFISYDKDSGTFRNVDGAQPLNGWLGLLATENWEQAEQLIRIYPWLEPIYKEMSEYMKDPGEVLRMYSEALELADRNTIRYMVEEMSEQIAEQQHLLNEKDNQLNEKDNQLNEKDNQLNEKDNQLSEKDSQLNEKDNQISEQIGQIAEQQEQIKFLQKRLKELEGQ